MIVYAAIVPHATALLIESPERAEQFPTVGPAITLIAQHLYARQPDTLVFVSSHKAQAHQSCTIDHMPLPVMHMETQTGYERAELFPPDIETSAILRAASESSGEFMYANTDALDESVLVSLALLSKHLPKTRALSITTAHRDLRFHFTVGTLLEDVLTMLPARYAVLATGDLAQVPNLDASAHRARLNALQFDREFLHAVTDQRYDEALELGRARRKSVTQCLLDPAAVLFGALWSHRATPELLGYESPTGTGVAVVEFAFGV